MTADTSSRLADLFSQRRGADALAEADVVEGKQREAVAAVHQASSALEELERAAVASGSGEPGGSGSDGEAAPPRRDVATGEAVGRARAGAPARRR